MKDEGQEEIKETSAPSKMDEINFAQTLEEVRSKSDLVHISVPPHRIAPLKQNWELIVKTIVEHMKLQIRMNTKKKAVEIKVSLCCLCRYPQSIIAIKQNRQFSFLTESH